MKKILPSLILAITFITSCKQSNSIKINTEVSNAANTSFASSVSQIKTLGIPLTFYCGAETYTWASEFGNEIETRTPITSNSSIGVVGKLPVNNEKV